MSVKELLGFRKKAGQSYRGPSVWTLHAPDAKLDAARYSNRLSYDDLLVAESELGRTIFGPIPEGHQREFFKHRKNVWLWHESWTNAVGMTEQMTIRYEVRPTGVYKKAIGGAYQKLEGAELDNFCNAVRSYYNLVKTKLYS
ncbi:hypothetical protein IKE79_00800 [Candidatus Saccharibacteria bacterium]|nr:hypothetical protein [Candidatus Saccharibacteria bacterium]